MAKTVDPYWYRKGWSLEIADMSWVEQTLKEVEFITSELSLTGSERILDIACGYGRHSLEFARRGFEVVGSDITKEYIQVASDKAAEEDLNIHFFVADARDIRFANEFDVVLVLHGLIGFLETDEENLKVFDVIAKALRSNGKHFMDLTNAAHAEVTFPSRGWDVGTKTLSLADFDWNPENRRMIYTGYVYRYGEPLMKPDLNKSGSSIRLYNIDELDEIMKERGLRIVKTYGDWDAQIPMSERRGPLLVYSHKLN